MMIWKIIDSVFRMAKNISGSGWMVKKNIGYTIVRKKERTVGNVRSEWNKKLCSKNKEYSQKQITLTSVIAIALERGPLRKRYMTIKKRYIRKAGKRSEEAFCVFI